MLKGGVIMDVTNVEEARIAEEAGAVAVMALERVPAGELCVVLIRVVLVIRASYREPSVSSGFNVCHSHCCNFIFSRSWSASQQPTESIHSAWSLRNESCRSCINFPHEFSADIRRDGGVARMSDPAMVTAIKQAVTIPVMAKARIGHFVEAQILEALDIDYIDESEVQLAVPPHCHRHSPLFCRSCNCTYFADGTIFGRS